ncbi:MAG: GNAT family acetyltransferase [Desulfosarcinaceae bacterium]|nr:GNAT family acetyltransferase [Desulfosarcinaceae bacterium]
MNANPPSTDGGQRIVVRAYHTEDEQAVIQLWQTCGLTRPWNDPRRDIVRKQAVQPELFLVAVAEEELVGSVMGGYDGHRGWAYYLAVHPAYRSQGIARRMMQQLERSLEAMGCPKINLMVRTDNAAAHGFYQRIGYTRDEVNTLSRRLIPDD